MNNRIYPLNCLALALLTLGIAIYLFAIPKFLDDWWFMHHLRPWFDKQGPTALLDGGNPLKYGIPWHAFADTIIDHYHTDNLRIANWLALPFLLFPKWAGVSLSVACWVYIMYASLRLAGVDIRRSPLVGLAIFLWVLGVQWRDSIICMMFQFNYMLPAAGLLWLLRILSNHPKSTRSAAIFLLALVVAMCHEGYAIVQLSGLTALLLCYRMRVSSLPNVRANSVILRRQTILALIATLLGLAYLLCSPHIYVRGEGELFANEITLARLLTICIGWHPASAIYLTFVCLMIIKQGWSRFVGDAINVFITGGVIGALILSVGFYTARSGWQGDILAIIGLLRIPSLYWPGYWQTYRRATAIGSALLVATALSTLALSDVYAVKYGRIFDRAVRQYALTGENVYFADVTTDENKPYLTSLFINNQFIFEPHRFMGEYFGRRDYNEWLKILPRELEDFDFDKCRRIPGDAKVREIAGLYIYRLEDAGTSRIDGKFDIQLGPISRRRTDSRIILFTNRHDGRRYGLLIFRSNKLLIPIFGITQLNHPS